MEFPYFIKLEGLLNIPGFSAMLCCLYLSVSSAALFAEWETPWRAVECLCTLKCLSWVWQTCHQPASELRTSTVFYNKETSSFLCSPYSKNTSPLPSLNLAHVLLPFWVALSKGGKIIDWLSIKKEEKRSIKKEEKRKEKKKKDKITL